MKRAFFPLAMIVFAAAGFLMIHFGQPDSFSLAASPRVKNAIPAMRPDSATTAAQQRIAAGIARQPLRFEPNSGQTDSRVKYVARGDGYTLFLTGNQAVMKLRQGPPPANPRLAESRLDKSTGVPARAQAQTASVLSFQLEGANVNAVAVGEEPLAGTSNYFLGNDPSQWRAGVTDYGRVHYSSVYPGVDLVYYGNQDALEYDFDVAPGANPEAIRLKLNGAERAEVAANGDLMIHAGGGDVRLHAPVIYQTENGKQTTVSGGFALLSKNEAGFRLGAYDHSRALVIDPVVQWSTYLGGSDRDLLYGLAVDAAGDVYVTGTTYSTDYPITKGSFQTKLAGNLDSYVSKISSDGSTLLYSTFIGGKGSDMGTMVAVDASGDAYLTGQTASKDFPVTKGAFQTRLAGATNAYIAELNPSGSALLYSTFIGGRYGTYGYYIALDSKNDAFITGITSSYDFPVTKNAYQKTYEGGQDTFVTGVNPTGTALVYSSLLGKTMQQWGFAIAVASDGGIVIGGATNSSAFPVTSNAFQGTQKGLYFNGFITRFAPNGRSLDFSTYFGGSLSDGIQGLALDSKDNIYVTGFSKSKDFPLKNAFDGTHKGATDAFISAMAADGQSLIYSSWIGGSNRDCGWGIAVDSNFNAYLGGYTLSSDFPLKNPIQSTFGGGLIYGDAFMAKIDPAGNLLVSTYWGGSSDDGVWTLGLDSSANVYAAGRTYSTDFPTASPLQGTYAGAGDGWVGKFSMGSGDANAPKK